MSTLKKVWRVAWRVGLCGLLLAWIFQTIFWNEGKTAWEAQGHHAAWDALSRAQRLSISWTYGPAELWRNLRLIQPDVLALSIILAGLTVYLGMLRWRLVLRAQGIDLSLSRATEISFVAHFFNSFLLGSTGGDLMKAYYAARETHHKKTEAVVTVFVDRLIGIFSMLVFAAVMMLPNLSLMLATKRLEALAVFVLAMLVASGVLLAVALRSGVSKRFPRARVWLRKLPKGPQLKQSIDACRTFGRQTDMLWKCLGLSMVLNVVCVLQFMVISNGTQIWGFGSEGLGLGVSAFALMVIVPMIICISAVPITPSGLGVRENLYVFMLSAPQINVPRTPALSLSLLAFAGSLFWSLAGGVVYATFKQRHHLDDVSEEV